MSANVVILVVGAMAGDGRQLAEELMGNQKEKKKCCISERFTSTALIFVECLLKLSLGFFPGSEARGEGRERSTLMNISSKPLAAPQLL